MSKNFKGCWLSSASPHCSVYLEKWIRSWGQVNRWAEKVHDGRIQIGSFLIANLGSYDLF